MYNAPPANNKIIRIKYTVAFLSFMVYLASFYESKVLYIVRQILPKSSYFLIQYPEASSHNVSMFVAVNFDAVLVALPHKWSLAFEAYSD
jgi:hypothetical protein